MIVHFLCEFSTRESLPKLSWSACARKDGNSEEYDQQNSLKITSGIFHATWIFIYKTKEVQPNWRHIYIAVNVVLNKFCVSKNFLIDVMFQPWTLPRLFEKLLEILLFWKWRKNFSEQSKIWRILFLILISIKGEKLLKENCNQKSIYLSLTSIKILHLMFSFSQFAFEL